MVNEIFVGGVCVVVVLEETNIYGWKLREKGREREKVLRWRYFDFKIYVDIKIKIKIKINTYL